MIYFKACMVYSLGFDVLKSKWIYGTFVYWFYRIFPVVRFLDLQVRFLSLQFKVHLAPQLKEFEEKKWLYWRF